MDGNGLYTDHLRGDTVERGHRCDKRGNGSSLVLRATKKMERKSRKNIPAGDYRPKAGIKKEGL